MFSVEIADKQTDHLMVGDVTNRGHAQQQFHPNWASGTKRQRRRDTNFLNVFIFQEVASAQEKIYQERKDRERQAIAKAREARRETRAQRLEKHFMDICPALLMPHAQKSLRRLGEALDAFGKHSHLTKTHEKTDKLMVSDCRSTRSAKSTRSKP